MHVNARRVKAWRGRLRGLLQRTDALAPFASIPGRVTAVRAERELFDQLCAAVALLAAPVARQHEYLEAGGHPVDKLYALLIDGVDNLESLVQSGLVSPAAGDDVLSLLEEIRSVLLTDSWSADRLGDPGWQRLREQAGAVLAELIARTPPNGSRPTRWLPAEGAFEQLCETVAPIAAPADEQRDYLERNGYPVDELYQDLVDAQFAFLERLERHRLIGLTGVQGIESLLLTMDSEIGPESWQIDRLDDPAWELVRAKAREVLTVLDARRPRLSADDAVTALLSFLPPP